MKDNLKVYLNKKKVLIFAPISAFLFIMCILFLSLAIHYTTNLYDTQTIQQNKDYPLAILIICIVYFLLAIPFFIGIILAISLAIRAIRKKEVLVINHRGILYNQHYTLYFFQTHFYTLELYRRCADYRGCTPRSSTTKTCICTFK